MTRAVRAVGDLGRGILIAVATISILVGAGLLLARYSYPATGPDLTGIVVDTDQTGAKRYLTVEDADGSRDRARVPVGIFRACPVGAAWPACKASVRRG